MPSQINSQLRPRNRYVLGYARFSLFAVLFVVALCAAKDAAASGLVQTSANATSATASSLSFSFPNNTAAGDVILVGFDYDSNSYALSVVDSQGNTFTPVVYQLTTPGGSRCMVYLATNITGGADTVTVNLTGNSAFIEAYASEYSGVNQANPIDARAGASGSAGYVSSGYGVTSTPGDIIYGYCVGDWACTVGPGFTPASTFNDNLIENEITDTTGSYAATGYATNGWAMQMVALRPAAGATGQVASVSATAAAVTVSPSSLTFASQAIDTASAAQVVTISNTGGAALSISSIALTGSNAGSFTEVSTCGASLAAGSSCTVAILFDPASSTASNAALTITDSASGGTQSVSLSGAGGGGHNVVLTWSPSPTPEVTGYNIYRGTVSGGESSTPLNSTPIDGASFTDGNVTAGATYYYIVKGVYSTDSLTSDSNEASATVPSP